MWALSLAAFAKSTIFLLFEERGKSLVSEKAMATIKSSS
jgi:hypothetical protein